MTHQYQSLVTHGIYMIDTLSLLVLTLFRFLRIDEVKFDLNSQSFTVCWDSSF